MATYRLTVSVDIVTDEPVDSDEFKYLMAASFTNWIVEDQLHNDEVINPELVKVEKISDEN